MKYVLILLGLIATACSTQIGTPRNGQSPELTEVVEGPGGYIFEYSQVSFTAPEFEVYLDYPSDFQGLSTDMHLVYFLWDVDEDADGNPLDIWRLIPQTVFTPDGALQYNYDASSVDVRLFMEAEFDLYNLGAGDTDDWVARVVVLPASDWNARRDADYANYQEVERIVLSE
jgi:hypothetical protein